MAHCEGGERAALRGPPDCVAHRAIGRAYMKQSYRSHHEFLAAEHAAQPDRDGEADDAARASAAGDEEKKNGEGAESHSGVVSRAMGAAMAASVIYVTPPVTDALGGSTDKVGVPFGKGNGVEEGEDSGALGAPVMQDQGGGADREGQEEQEETRGQAVLLAQSKGKREGAEKERSKKRTKDKKARKKERKEAQRAQEEWDSDEARPTLRRQVQQELIVGAWRDFQDLIVTRLPYVNTTLVAEAELLALTTESGWWLRAEQGRVGRGTGVTANGEGGEAVGGDRGDEVESQASDDWVGAGMRQQQQGVYRACTEQQQQHEDRASKVAPPMARGSNSDENDEARPGHARRDQVGGNNMGAPGGGAPTSGR